MEMGASIFYACGIRYIVFRISSVGWLNSGVRGFQNIVRDHVGLFIGMDESLNKEKF